MTVKVDLRIYEVYACRYAFPTPLGCQRTFNELNIVFPQACADQHAGRAYQSHQVAAHHSSRKRSFLEHTSVSPSQSLTISTFEDTKSVVWLDANRKR